MPRVVILLTIHYFICKNVLEDNKQQIIKQEIDIFRVYISKAYLISLLYFITGIKKIITTSVY